MSYLIFNEDAKTVAHNTISTLFTGNHMMNAKDWDLPLAVMNPIGLPAAILKNLFRAKDNFDEAYFDSMYHISPTLKKKLQVWCSRIKGSSFTGDAMKRRHMANFTDVAGPNKWNTRDGVSVNLASQHTRMATRNIGKGAMTTATCFKIIPALSGKGHHIIYFTFDGNSIQDAKTLSFKGGDPHIPTSYRVVELTGFNSISPNEYKK